MTNNYFTLQELCRSQQASKAGISNIPDEATAVSLEGLIERLLNPLRRLYGKPLYINSGYRCPELNTLVGGKLTSQHIRGEAADIACPAPKELLELLLTSKLPFDQAICYSTFLHVSLRARGKQRYEVIYK